MNRSNRFTILLTDAERELIEKLAAKLDRTPSDAVRRLIHFAGRILDNDDDSEADYENP
jgi:Ribbon-helix-helix protein